MYKISILLLSLCFFTVSCQYVGGKRIRGNGTINTQNRSVGSFHSVSAGGNFNVYLSQGESPTVRVEADENLMQYIDVYTEGDHLYIETERGYNLRSSRGLKVYVSAPEFETVSVSGAGDIIGEHTITNDRDLDLHVSGAGNVRMDVKAPAVEVHVSGSGDIMLKGETKDFKATVSGAGNIKCFNMLAERANVRISGAGDAEVFASVQLDARVSGAGNVKYKGNPGTVNSSTSGAGSIHKVN